MIAPSVHLLPRVSCCKAHALCAKSGVPANLPGIRARRQLMCEWLKLEGRYKVLRRAQRVSHHLRLRLRGMRAS